MPSTSLPILHLPLAWMPSGGEWVVLAVLGLLLLFARHLPKVARTLGRGIVGFKQGLKGVEESMDDRISGGQGERGQDDVDSKLLPIFCLGFIALFCILAALEQASHGDRTVEGAILLAGGLAAIAMIWLCRRR